MATGCSRRRQRFHNQKRRKHLFVQNKSDDFDARRLFRSSSDIYRTGRVFDHIDEVMEIRGRCHSGRRHALTPKGHYVGDVFPVLTNGPMVCLFIDMTKETLWIYR